MQVKQVGYIVLTFGFIKSQNDFELFKEKHELKKTFFKKSLFNKFSFFRKKEKEPFSFYKSEFTQKFLQTLDAKALNFELYFSHRQTFLENLKNLKAEKWIVFPLTPIFNQGLSSAAAKIFADFKDFKKIYWIPSYSKTSSLINYFQKKIKEFLLNNGLLQKETTLLFSATLEKINFELYKQNALDLSKEILKAFPYILGKTIFSFDDNFFDENFFEDIKARKNVVFISFNELLTNYENCMAEKNIFPIFKKNNLLTFSLNFSFDKDWQEALEDIKEQELIPNLNFL